MNLFLINYHIFYGQRVSNKAKPCFIAYSLSIQNMLIHGVLKYLSAAVLLLK